MSSHLAGERWDHFVVMPHDSGKRYHFCRGKLHCTWKPKDITEATVILLNYEIF